MTKLEELNRVIPLLNKVGEVELRQARGIVMAAGAAIHEASKNEQLPEYVYTMFRVAQMALNLRAHETN
jgi:hypothetical protein